MRDINRVILHCAATPDYPEDNKRYDLFGVDDIDAWHRKRGFDGCGYHYVIRRTGALETGRDINKIGAHCKGENHDSIGVCLIGTRWPTEAQIDALVELFWYLRFEHGIECDQWFGHYEFNKRKTCPGIPIGLVRRLFKFATEADHG
jgi:hypothetical protein